MSESTFRILLIAVAILFTGIFVVVVVPPLIANPDVIGAFAAGFVNPYAAGYSSDVILCWLALAIWVIHEAKVYQVRHGWLCLLVGLVPGVAVGLAVYLVVRSHQIRQTRRDA